MTAGCDKSVHSVPCVHPEEGAAAEKEANRDQRDEAADNKQDDPCSVGFPDPCLYVLPSSRNGCATYGTERFVSLQLSSTLLTVRHKLDLPLWFSYSFVPYYK